MKKRKLHKRPRRPAPRFLGRPRELHGTLEHVDEPETIERIRAAVAICDEPEQIGPAILTYVEMANKADTARHAREVETTQEARKLLTVEQRLVMVEVRARRQAVDVAQDVFKIRKAMQRAEKGGRKPPMAVLVRLEKVEAQLDGVTDLPIQRVA